MRRILSIALLLIFMFTTNVFAFDYYIMSEGVIEVEGKAKENSLVSISLLKPDKKLSDLVLGTNENDIFAAYEEALANESGAYKTDVLIDGKSGIYTLITGTQANTSYKEETVYFIRESENTAARNLLATEGNITTVISENKYALGMDYELVSSETASDIATIFKNSISDASSLTAAEVTEALNKAGVIAAFSNNKISLFSAYYEKFGVDQKLNVWLNKSFITQSDKTELENALSKSYTSFSDFEKDLLEKTVLMVIDKADGYGNVKNVLNEFASDIPNINTTYITDTVCQKIIGNKYKDFIALLDAIEVEYNNSASNNTSPIKSSGGGGSSRGGSVASVAITALPKQEVVEPYAEKVSEFTDMENYLWAKDAVDKLAEIGVVKGKEDGKFYPGDLVLREEFVKMIMESIKFSNLYGEIEFDDVNKDSWYYTYVKNAYLARIVNGISETEFGSGRSISRQDMAVMICNALKQKGVALQKGENIIFADHSEISEYALSSVELLSSIGVISGDDNKNFNPKDSANRAEAAKMIYGILKYVE